MGNRHSGPPVAHAVLDGETSFRGEPVAKQVFDSNATEHVKAEAVEAEVECKPRKPDLSEEFLFHPPKDRFTPGEEVEVWTYEFQEAPGAASTNKWRCKFAPIRRAGKILFDHGDAYDVEVEASKDRYPEPLKVHHKIPYFLVRSPNDQLEVEDWYQKDVHVLCPRMNGETKGCLSLVRKGRVINGPSLRGKEICVDIMYYELEDKHVEFNVPIEEVGIDSIHYLIPPPK